MQLLRYGESLSPVVTDCVRGVVRVDYGGEGVNTPSMAIDQYWRLGWNRSRVRRFLGKGAEPVMWTRTDVEFCL
jgi:hypothetical protein